MTALIAVIAWSCSDSSHDLVELVPVDKVLSDTIIVQNNLSNDDPQLEKSYVFYLGVQEVPWNKPTEHIFTTANIDLYIPSKGTIVSESLDRRIQYFYFKSIDDSVTLTISKPGYRTIKYHLLVDQLSVWNKENPLLLTLTHSSVNAKPQIDMVGLSFNQDINTFQFVNVDWYGGESIIKTHDYQILGENFYDRLTNSYGYVGWRESDEASNEGYLVSVDPYDGTRSEVAIQHEGLTNGTLAYYPKKSGFFSLFHTPYVNFDLAFINRDGSYTRVHSFDEFGGIVGGWSTIDIEDNIYWFSAYKDNENYVLAYDIGIGAINRKLQPKQLDISSLKFHSQEKVFYGMAVSEDGDLGVGTMDLNGKEVVIDIDIKTPHVYPWSILDEENRHLYVARGAYSKYSGSKTEVIIVDLEDFSVLHSFRLKGVGMTSLNLRASRYLK